MPSAFAWHMLEIDQKEALERERRAGRFEFGGLGWKAPYLFVQEGSLPGAELSAKKAAITPTFFISGALVKAMANISGHIAAVLSS